MVLWTLLISFAALIGLIGNGDDSRSTNGGKNNNTRWYLRDDLCDVLKRIGPKCLFHCTENEHFTWSSTLLSLWCVQGETKRQKKWVTTTREKAGNSDRHSQVFYLPKWGNFETKPMNLLPIFNTGVNIEIVVLSVSLKRGWSIQFLIQLSICMALSSIDVTVPPSRVRAWEVEWVFMWTQDGADRWKVCTPNFEALC